MKKFKFLTQNQINNPRRIDRWIGINISQRIHWLTQPNSILYYVGSTEEHNEISITSQQLYSIRLHSFSHRISSYNNFIEQNRNKMIFAYHFIDELSGGLTYDANSFNNMPKDREMIFRGFIRDLNTSE